MEYLTKIVLVQRHKLTNKIVLVLLRVPSCEIECLGVSAHCLSLFADLNDLASFQRNSMSENITELFPWLEAPSQAQKRRKMKRKTNANQKKDKK